LQQHSGGFAAGRREESCYSSIANADDSRLPKSITRNFKPRPQHQRASAKASPIKLFEETGTVSDREIQIRNEMEPRAAKSASSARSPALEHGNQTRKEKLPFAEAQIREEVIDARGSAAVTQHVGLFLTDRFRLLRAAGTAVCQHLTGETIGARAP